MLDIKILDLFLPCSQLFLHKNRFFSAFICYLCNYTTLLPVYHYFGIVVTYQVFICPAYHKRICCLQCALGESTCIKLQWGKMSMFLYFCWWRNHLSSYVVQYFCLMVLFGTNVHFVFMSPVQNDMTVQHFYFLTLFSNSLQVQTYCVDMKTCIAVLCLKLSV